MIDVVSVSLGSAARDRTAVLRVAGQAVRLRRIGCGGDYSLAGRLLREMDGAVGAIGLGGLNFAYRLHGRNWPMPGAERLRQAVRRTPLVDGSLYKDLIEPRAAAALPGHGRALVVSMLDRPAAGPALEAVGYAVQAGDAHFALGVPLWPSETAFTALARVAMPLLRHLPRTAVYGPREHAEGERPRSERWDVIWGDVQLLRRRPVAVSDATFVCGSLRQEDARWLREHGVYALIAPSPPIDGEVFGANVWEAMLAALYGRTLRPEEIGKAWSALCDRCDWPGWVSIV